MHRIPVRQLHLILDSRIARDLARQALFTEGVLGTARDEGVTTLLHLLANSSLDAGREGTRGRAEFDQLKVVVRRRGESDAIHTTLVLDHDFVVAVRVSPSCALLVEGLEEDAAVGGDLALVPAQKLDLKEQRGVAGDLVPRAVDTVAIVGADCQQRLFSALHRRDALVPPLDDLSLPEFEGERRAAVARRVKLRAVTLQRADVVHTHVVILLRQIIAGSLHKNFLQHAPVASDIHGVPAAAQRDRGSATAQPRSALRDLQPRRRAPGTRRERAKSRTICHRACHQHSAHDGDHHATTRRARHASSASFSAPSRTPADEP